MPNLNLLTNIFFYMIISVHSSKDGTVAHQADLQVVEEADVASALLNPMRLDVLAALAEPGSATTVASSLGMPRQKVNYHVRELEKRGLLEQVGSRKRRNCTERILQSTARSYVVDPRALGPVQAHPANVRDQFSSAYLLAAAAKTLRDVATLRRGADAAGKKLATFTLESEVTFPSPAAQAAFLEELASATAELVSKYQAAPSDRGRPYRVTFTGHPVVPESNNQRPNTEESNDE